MSELAVDMYLAREIRLRPRSTLPRSSHALMYLEVLADTSESSNYNKGDESRRTVPLEIMQAHILAPSMDPASSKPLSETNTRTPLLSAFIRLGDPWTGV